MSISEHEGADADIKLRELLDAARTGDFDRPLPDLLADLASAAAGILDCQYVAVSVLGRDRLIEHFVPYGADPDASERIGRMPTHQGLLGAVVHDAVTVRVADITADPRTGDLPGSHPPITALLGVPIMVRGRSGGGLYFSAPQGRLEFSEPDARTAEAIATAAAMVIEKARTAAENRRRDRWLNGSADLTRDLLSGEHPDLLRLVADRAVDIADADLVTVVQPDPGSDGLVVTTAAGEGAKQWVGFVMPVSGTVTLDALATGRAMNLAHLSESSFPKRYAQMANIDSLIVVPLRMSRSGPAAVVFSRRPGRAAFTAAEMGMATMFVGQVALALELAVSQAHRDQLALIDERDRIARDLHDHVIQRLFAIGLTMQNASAHLSGEAARRMLASVDDIDATIKQIRATIYQLTAPIVSSQASIRAQAARLIDDLELALGFRPELELEGPVDFGVSEDVIDDCIAVLREALSNVARHAQATHAEVVIAVSTTSITLEVRDNGRGMGTVARRSGLANLRARAEGRDGSLLLRDNGSHGTRLVWSIPVEAGVPARLR
jgi:signal transduction histidine kinase